MESRPRVGAVTPRSAGSGVVEEAARVAEDRVVHLEAGRD